MAVSTRGHLDEEAAENGQSDKNNEMISVNQMILSSTDIEQRTLDGDAFTVIMRLACHAIRHAILPSQYRTY